MLKLSEEECRNLDTELEKTMEWAQTRTAEAEQLAFDATRLLSCTDERFDQLKNQNFFKRCWNRFSGKAGEIERANTNDLIQMQKLSFRYINLLQERDLLLGHTMLGIKNNLLALAVKETETRSMIQKLAERTLNRFERLESRMDQVEISVNVQGWLLTLEEMNYTQKYPTSYLRMLRLVNDFYENKRDGWTYKDLLFMRSALRKSDLIPEQFISMNDLIENLVDEIYEEGFEKYQNLLLQWKPDSIQNYSEFVLGNISCQVGATLHGLVHQYLNQKEFIEGLKEHLAISEKDALKQVLKAAIRKLNVDLSVQIPLAEIAFEIFGYMRLAEKLIKVENEIVQEQKVEQLPQETIIDESVSSLPAKASLTSETPLAKDIKSAEISWDLLMDLPFQPKNIVDFAYGDNAWLLCIKTENDIFELYSSSDGKQWKPILTKGSVNDLDWWNRPNRLKYENKTWLLFNDNVFHYSDDMINWHSTKLDNISESLSTLEDIFFHDNNHWVFITKKQKSFSYTRQGLFRKVSDTFTRLYSEVFFYSSSLNGPWEKWQDASNFPDDRIYCQQFFKIGKNILAKLHYKTGFDDAYHESYDKKADLFCLLPGQGWTKIIWPTSEDSKLYNHYFLVEYKEELVCLKRWLFGMKQELAVSTNGIEWKGVSLGAKMDVNYIVVIDNVLCIFDTSNLNNENKLFISNDAKIFHQISWDCKGSLVTTRTNNKIILATMDTNNEIYLQVGTLKFPEA